MAKPICTGVLGFFGLAAGLGLGLYAAVQNYNPEEHQSANMTESMQGFIEVMQQALWTIGIATLWAGIGTSLGCWFDCFMACLCCCCGNDNEYQTIGLPSSFPSMSSYRS